MEIRDGRSRIKSDPQRLFASIWSLRDIAIQRYVRQSKIDAGRAIGSIAFVPLAFAPGDVAQFDWSCEHVVLGGATTSIKLAHFRLAHSRQMFVGDVT